MNHLKILNEFAQDKADLFDVSVEITEHRTSYKPKNPSHGAFYEDVIALSSNITGAQSFMYWLRRKGYEICKKSRKG